MRGGVKEAEEKPLQGKRADLLNLKSGSCDQGEDQNTQDVDLKKKKKKSMETILNVSWIRGTPLTPTDANILFTLKLRKFQFSLLMFSLSVTINKITGTDTNLQKNVLSHRLLYVVLIRLLSFDGVPGWLSRLNGGLWLRSWAQRFVGSSPVSGSLLTAWSLEPASDSVSPSFSLPLPCSRSVSLFLSKINKHFF